jgi:transcriptional regulator
MAVETVSAALSTGEHALKKGTAELLVLAQLEDEPRHGYDIGQRIEQRSGGAVSFNVASLYPILYRLEAQGVIAGWWLEKPGQRRRRFYKLTAAGRRKLAQQRQTWSAFMLAVQRAAGLVDYA